MVRAARAVVPCHAFTNTNATHHDLLENVEGARSGLKAVLVRSPRDVRDALRREGMIPA